MPRWLPVLFLSLTLQLPMPTLAVPEGNTANMPAAPVGAAELANITLGLFLVLALIFVLAWLFRRYGNMATFNRSNIQVLGGVSLGNRERAVLLEVEGERILVGVAPGHVSRLHILPTVPSSEPAVDQTFSSELKQAAADKKEEQP